MIERETTRKLQDFSEFFRRLRLQHVVFYRLRKAGGILVVRILHQRMLPEKHAIDQCLVGSD